MTATLGVILLGLLLGVRHAVEPDHLAAVSVLASESPSPRRGAILGLFWGVGHSFALLVVAVALAILSTGMPDRMTDGFELGVAVMLIALGVRGFARAVRSGRGGPARLHRHGRSEHVHPGPPAHVHLASTPLATRPLVVGMIHGLAGSGALTAMVAAELPTLGGRIAFIALFGMGSVLGMAVVSGLAGWPLAQLGRKPSAAKLVHGTAGAASAVFGIALGWPLALRLFG